MTMKSENQDQFDLETATKSQGPVECLGMTFENDAACNRVLRCELRVKDGKD